MVEYIEREAAKKEILNNYFGQYGQGVARVIDRVPTADVAPVVHGRWVEKQGGFWETATCSNCGEKYQTVGIIPHYCPNCGARMDKEASHE